MNKNQKITIYIAVIIILITIIIWQFYGGEIFTKTQIVTEVNDELWGTRKELVDQFVWGLDLSGLISGLTVVISSILLFVFRTKKK